MSRKFTLESHYRIYNDDCGYYFTVRPDSDGLDMIEIAYHESDEKVSVSDVRLPPMTKDEALLLIGALTKMINEPPKSITTD